MPFPPRPCSSSSYAAAVKKHLNSCNENEDLKGDLLVIEALRLSAAAAPPPPLPPPPPYCPPRGVGAAVVVGGGYYYYYWAPPPPPPALLPQPVESRRRSKASEEDRKLIAQFLAEGHPEDVQKFRAKYPELVVVV